MSRLDSSQSLDSFVFELRFVLSHVMNLTTHEVVRASAEELRQFRIDWLKSLVLEFEALGD